MRVEIRPQTGQLKVSPQTVSHLSNNCEASWTGVCQAEHILALPVQHLIYQTGILLGLLFAVNSLGYKNGFSWLTERARGFLVQPFWVSLLYHRISADRRWVWQNLDMQGYVYIFRYACLETWSYVSSFPGRNREHFKELKCVSDTQNFMNLTPVLPLLF